MNKIKNVVFRCFFNNGDLHLVRSLIRYVTNILPNLSYQLTHPQSVKTLGDLSIPLLWNDPSNYRKFDNRGYHIEGETLIMNVQYLAFNGYFFNQFGPTIMTVWNIFNKTLKEVFNIELPKDYSLFLPKIDYSYYETDVIDSIISKNQRSKNILICNNLFESKQAIDFDFDNVISTLSHSFPNYTFYVTNTSNIINENIVHLYNRTKSFVGGNLNEISYLSTKCNVLMGRNSGPHTFCYVKENLFDHKAIFVSFSDKSPLYGDVPEKWIDFGIRSFTDKDKCAKFYNITTKKDRKRTEQLCQII